MSQQLSIDFNLCFLKKRNQTTVSKPGLPASCVNPLNPETSKVSLLLLSPDICINKFVIESHFGNCVTIPTSAIKPFGLVHHPFSSCSCFGPSFDSCHIYLSLIYPYGRSFVNFSRSMVDTYADVLFCLL